MKRNAFCTALELAEMAERERAGTYTLTKRQRVAWELIERFAVLVENGWQESGLEIP